MINKRWGSFILIASLVIIFALSFMPQTVKAQAMARAKILVLVEAELHNDMDVSIINTEDETDIYKFIVTESDGWELEFEIPEGMYIVEASVVGFGKNGKVRSAAQNYPVLVKADSDYNTFTVLQTRYNKIDEYSMVLGINYERGTEFKGIINEDVVNEMTRIKQGLHYIPDGTDANASDGTGVKITDEDKENAEIVDLDSDFKEEAIEPEEIDEAAEDEVAEIKANEEEGKDRNYKKIGIIGVSALLVGVFVFMSQSGKKDK